MDDDDLIWNINDTIETKQEFLRKEIIEQGYDGEEFQDFMTSMHPNQTDIDLSEWDMTELQAVVIKFKTEVSKGNIKKSEPALSKMRKSIWDPLSIEEEETTTKDKDDKCLKILEKEDDDIMSFQSNYGKAQKLSQKEEKNTQIKTTSTSISETNLKEAAKSIMSGLGEGKPLELEEDDDDDELNSADPNDPLSRYDDVVSCKKQEPTTLTDQTNLIMTISDPQTIKTGMFSSSFVQYKLTTEELRASVVRKMKDFEWLREKLSSLYPCFLIPPLPPAHYNLKDDSPKKMVYLERFINGISEIRTIRSSMLFKDFLTLSQNDFDAKRKEIYDKIEDPKSIKHFYNLDGIIQIKISKKAIDRANDIYKEVYKRSDLYKKMDYVLEEITNAFETLRKKFGELSTCFENIKKSYEGDGILDKGFERFSEVMKDWSQGYSNQRDFYRDQIKYYFKFMQKEIDETIPLFSKFKTSKDTYEAQFKKVKKLQNQDSREDKALDSAKKFFAYTLTMLVNQYKELIYRHRDRMIHQFIIIDRNKDKYIQDYIHFINLIQGNN